MPQFLRKNRKALTESKLDATKSSLKRLGKARKKMIWQETVSYLMKLDLQGIKNMKYLNHWKVISSRKATN